MGLKTMSELNELSALSHAELIERVLSLEQTQLKLRDYNVRSDERGFEAKANFSGEAVKAFANLALQWFRESGGVNFVTLELTDSCSGEGYSLTMQKAGGTTPAEKLRMLKDELAALRAQLEKATGPSEAIPVSDEGRIESPVAPSQEALPAES
jgi:ribosomal protein L29